MIFSLPAGEPVHQRPGNARLRRARVVDREPRVPAVRGRHVPRVGVQRRRRHVDADPPELLLLLAGSGSARVDPRGHRRARARSACSSPCRSRSPCSRCGAPCSSSAGSGSCRRCSAGTVWVFSPTLETRSPALRIQIARASAIELARRRKHRGAGESLATFDVQRPAHRDAFVARHHLAANRCSELTEHDRSAFARRPQREAARTIERRPQKLCCCRRAERLVDDPRRGDTSRACVEPSEDAQAIARLALRAADEASGNVWCSKP